MSIQKSCFACVYMEKLKGMTFICGKDNKEYCPSRSICDNFKEKKKNDESTAEGKKG